MDLTCVLDCLFWLFTDCCDFMLAFQDIGSYDFSHLFLCAVKISALGDVPCN